MAWSREAEESRTATPRGSPQGETVQMKAPGDASMVGATVGSFRILKELGRGGMGAVYLGEQTVIGSKVAIKFLHDELATDPSLVQRFFSEARAVNLIGHANIVSIFDMGVVPPNHHYLVMEYLEGRELGAEQGALLPVEQVVNILLQVCDALEAAHRAGIVHRDLKPANLFLIERGRGSPFVKVLDFGIAKLMGQQARNLTSVAGLIIGTPEYMAPEQATGVAIDGRTDLYALGVIAYQLVTGRLPFQVSGIAQLLIAHAQAVPRPPIELRPDLPRSLSDVILKALEKRPADRHQSARAFGAALEGVLEELKPRVHDTALSLAAVRSEGKAGLAPPVLEPPDPSAFCVDGPDEPQPVIAAELESPLHVTTSRAEVAPNPGSPLSPSPWEARAFEAREPAFAPGGYPLPGLALPSSPVAPSASGPSWSSKPAPPDAAASSQAAWPGHPSASSLPRAAPPGQPIASSPPQAAWSGQPFASSPSQAARPAEPYASSPSQAARPGQPHASSPVQAVRPGRPVASSPSQAARPAEPSASSPSQAARPAHPSASSPSQAVRPAPSPPPPASASAPFASAPSRAAPHASSPSQANDVSPLHEVRVRDHRGADLGVLKCRDLSHGGAFICSSAAVPPLFSMVRVELLNGSGLHLEAEVVRHVPAELAAAWGLPPGYAVQFGTLTAHEKAALDVAIRGPSAKPISVSPTSEATCKAVLARYEAIGRLDHYGLLGAAPGDDFEHLRAQGRARKKELEELLAGKISDVVRARLENAQQRLGVSIATLSHPASRLEFDASRRNHEGVARCLATGLPSTVVAEVRRRFLAGHPGSESNGTIRSMMAHAFEMKNALKEALGQYHLALQADPLNPVVQQRYWALKKQLSV